ncbi:MAG TPA: VC0807 family protein [Acidimicrobiales bacterium]|nr:VC0807 family protein [Acidimicrobiales bacterium]
MEPGPAPGAGGPEATAPSAAPAPPPELASDGWTPGIPSVREHLPSLVFGAALPIGIYFAVRSHVHTDAQALIVAGLVSVAWIVIQFARQRRLDFVGAIVLVGFAVGVGSSTLLGGNSYVLKIRDAFFTALFGVACIVTIYTAKRPALFYVSRYLSAGSDSSRVAAYNQLFEFETGRRTFRVLSVVWGIGLVVEASVRMVLAEALHTSTFLAVSPFITASVIGGLFAFTVLYAKRAQLEAAALMTGVAEAPRAAEAPEASGPPGPTRPADEVPQIPLP